MTGINVHVSVTDEAVREIAEQVSQAMRRRLPRLGGTTFDIVRGVEMYRGHLGISVPSLEMSLQDAAQRPSDGGGAPNDVGVYVLKFDGRPVYVGQAINLRKRLQEHYGARKSSEIIGDNREKLTVELHLAGSSDAAQSLEAKKIDEFKTNIDDGGWNKRIERPLSVMPDAGRRISGNIAMGVISDLALFSVGGAALEVRDAWRNPGEMSLADRCVRLVRAIWNRFLASVKERSLRELGAEAITAVAAVLTAPLKMAATAVERIVATLRRLWMDFVAGKLKTLEDVVSAGLKAVFAVASAGVALAVESQLAPLFAAAGPVGDILAALCAAVAAGVMIVIGNRSIDHIVRSLFALFRGPEIARHRRQEIEAFCAEAVPGLVMGRHNLEALVETHLAEREELYSCTFADLKSARDTGDIDSFISALNKLSLLSWRTFDEFDRFMQSEEPLRI